MNDAPSHQDDPSIPVLTEVLDTPLYPPRTDAGAPKPAPPVAPSSFVPPAEPAAPQVSDDESLDRLRVAVLKDLQVRLNPLLQARMREHVEAAVSQALADLLDGLQLEVARLVEEALHKELIRLAAQQEPQRGKPRDDPPASDH